MNQTARVLVGVDGSEFSIRALSWAARFAGLSGDQLTVVTTWNYPTSYGFPMVLPDWDFAAQARQVLDEAVAKAFGDDEPSGLGRMVAQGHPGVVLVAASEQADLLVVGSRGHGELAGMLIGSVSEYCVTHAHCPVVVIRGDHGQP